MQKIGFDPLVTISRMRPSTDLEGALQLSCFECHRAGDTEEQTKPQVEGDPRWSLRSANAEKRFMIDGVVRKPPLRETVNRAQLKKQDVKIKWWISTCTRNVGGAAARVAHLEQ